MISREEIRIIEKAKQAGMQMPALSPFPIEDWLIKAQEFLMQKGLECSPDSERAAGEGLFYPLDNPPKV